MRYSNTYIPYYAKYIEYSNVLAEIITKSDKMNSLGLAIMMMELFFTNYNWVKIANILKSDDKLNTYIDTLIPIDGIPDGQKIIGIIKNLLSPEYEKIYNPDTIEYSISILTAEMPEKTTLHKSKRLTSRFFAGGKKYVLKQI